MHKWYMLVLAGLFLAGACTRKGRTIPRAYLEPTEEQYDSLFRALMGEPSERPDSLSPLPHRARSYQGSYPMRWQLIHTDLSLSLDWSRKELPGEAQLTLKPYFAPQSTLTLDAKAMQIEEVRLLRPSTGRIVAQVYDSLRLTLTLDRPYTARETLVVYIRYRAQPERLEDEGSVAIGGRKGAYFINAQYERPCVPRQFWTQGEPESASAWFPTLDSPNQKTTQRLCVTTEDSLVSLSNGLLVKQEKLPGGLRRDCWELKQPHAPYLFALAVGPFRVVKDSWRGKEVSYYMEPGWESEARAIFGRTPQMLEFFSQRFGVEFPWPKYGQVIVRDFVSGAMENTTAVIHGDMLFYDDAKALTEDYETVVAHELMHHWFGDLVTCESWAQLPVNESFADYSEYLWLEHSRGLEAAELHRIEAYYTYLAEARTKQVPLIRFEYGDPMAMFDAHSYQKGGLTLHLLRRIVGDSAFFLSLRQYLTDNAYQAADIDHLRHAFEKVTGEDWTWFFDQHFRRADEVRFILRGEQRGDTAILGIFQRGYDTLRGPYRYFIKIALASAGGYEELPLQITGDTLVVLVRSGLKWADIDPERLFIGQTRRSYPRSWWEGISQGGRYFWPRIEALPELQPFWSAESAKLQQALLAYRRGGPFWRQQMWEAFQLVADTEAVAQISPLLREALKDTAPIVRAAAWKFLSNALDQELLLRGAWRAEVQAALTDPSSEVQKLALQSLYAIDTSAALAEARRRIASRSEELFLQSAELLLAQRDSAALKVFLERYPCLAGLRSRAKAMELLVQAYQNFPAQRSQLLALIERTARYENPWYLRLQLVFRLKRQLGRDPEIKRLLQRLREEEKHPRLREIYERLL